MVGICGGRNTARPVRTDVAPALCWSLGSCGCTTLNTTLNTTTRSMWAPRSPAGPATSLAAQKAVQQVRTLKHVWFGSPGGLFQGRLHTNGSSPKICPHPHAGRGCVSCPAGSTGFYPSPRKSLLPTGEPISSSLKAKSWTQTRLCTPCAALNCKPGACLPNGGCKQCSPRHYFAEMEHKELTDYLGVMLPQNFKSCVSCDKAKCGECDQSLGCKTW